MRKYRVGIIGCGPRALQHAAALREMPEVEIAGAADPVPECLAKLCDRFEVENRYASSTQLLESGPLDLVTIVTRPEPKPALVAECAEAGVPVINIEKVAAYSLALMDGMMAACFRAGSLLTVNHQMRFLPQFQAVHELVASGRLGRVVSMRVGSRGSLTEQGSHVMDQMLYMNGDSPARWVMGQCDGIEGYARKHRAPSTCSAHLEFENGVRGTLECGILAPELFPESGFWLQKQIEVTGTEGWAGAYVNNGWRALLSTGEVLSGPGTWVPNEPAQAALFREGLAWIEDRSRLHPCRGELALRGLEALMAVCQSAVDRGAIPLPLDRSRDPLSEVERLLGPELPAR